MFSWPLQDASAHGLVCKCSPQLLAAIQCRQLSWPAGSKDRCATLCFHTYMHQLIWLICSFVVVTAVKPTSYFCYLHLALQPQTDVAPSISSTQQAESCALRRPCGCARSFHAHIIRIWKGLRAVWRERAQLWRSKQSLEALMGQHAVLRSQQLSCRLQFLAQTGCAGAAGVASCSRCLICPLQGGDPCVMDLVF